MRHANLKVGDRVVIDGDSLSLSRVERFTKTLIITTGDVKFRKSGHTPGAWSRSMLREPTPEIVDQIRQEGLARKLKRYDWSKLPLETLVEVCELLP